MPERGDKWKQDIVLIPFPFSSHVSSTQKYIGITRKNYIQSIKEEMHRFAVHLSLISLF